MPLLSPKFIITTGYAIVSLVCYVLLIIVIIKERKTLKGSFFQLFLCQSILNVYTYLNSVVTLRLPQNTCGDCLLAGWFRGKHFTGLEIFHTVHFQMAFVQYLFSLLISTNRLWMMIFPTKYENHWSFLIYPAVLLVTFSPLIVTKTFLLNYSYYSYIASSDWFAIQSTTNLAAVYDVLLPFMVVVTVACGLVNFSTFLLLRGKNHNNKKSEINLVIYSFVGFLTEGFGAATTVLNRLASTQSSDSVTWYMKMGQTFVPFFSDGLTLTPPIILILCSSHIRTGLKNLFCWRKISPTATVSASGGR